MAELKLWGFDGSTYVRTVKMLLAEKEFTGFEQDPVNVLKGEPHSAEHLQRHPFGKVPVIEYRGFRVYETAAIARYLNSMITGRDLVPAEAENVARMDMAIGIIDSYGYPAMLGGVAAYHLFPDFVGGKDEAKHHEALKTTRTVLTELMRLRGKGPWIAGEDLSIADLYLAPVFAYVAQTPHADEFNDVPGFADWWGAAQQLESFRATKPQG
ncbi:glutathione S-transferase family protein [Aureimonas jatrophae]|jgi:glutathione S-transferase|uniref:Glutathione S-transferase n=1 Tax=Aureimonas jatrophae TaxID=1166073 RepID=A0A1H0IHY2_9HYPH|nr:glutathione S-transferase family protein [Aureimonas jatrophae]MBB3952176.1 glutathione S-transferase [Aureimonas jatrophae]SDO30880.1 glutathione S-transferase [Aureimonas jatrophae]